MFTRAACVRCESPKDCGPAALATVARHYGARVSTLRLAALLHTDLQGTDLKSLRDGAESLGFEAACGVLQPDALDRIALPLIAHLQGTTRGHFVVLHKVGPTKVVVADPSRGVVAIPRHEFVDAWSRQVVLLRPSPQFNTRRQQHAPFVDLMRIAASERGLLWSSAWLATVATLLAFGTSFFLKSVLDTVIPTSDLTLLRLIGAGVCVVVLTRAASAALRQYLLAAASQKVSLSLGLDYIQRLLHLPMSFYDTRHSGEIFARFIDTPKITGAITGSLLAVFLDLCLLSISGAFLVWFTPSLGLVIMTLFPVVLATTWLSLSLAKGQERQIQERFGGFSNRFIETIGGARIIKAYTDEQGAYERLAAGYTMFHESVRRLSTLGIVAGATSTIITGMATIGLVWIGAHAAIEKRISIGELMFLYSVLGFFLSSIERVGPSLAAVQQGLVSVERFNDIRGLPMENSGPRQKLGAGDVCEHLELRGVAFSYHPSRPVLKDVNIVMESGETIALLGETGSGKSTCISLINGLNHPTAGRVLANGRDTRDLDLVALRRTVALVMQDPGIIAGSIRENIALGSSQATFGDIQDAARRALAHDFVVQLPRAYEYEVGQGGSGLSCGQKQRIAIARALLRKPSVLLLDEATSNLDPETEQLILRQLQLESDRRITVIATHRLAVAAQADRIIVLQGGTVIESGTHDVLLAKGGKYHSMWRALTSTAERQSRQECVRQ